MDVYEATRVVFSRIQALDPDNTAKIMGLLLIQDHGDKEMIRLAFGPEVLIHSVVLKARKELGLVPSSWALPPFSRANSCNGNRSATMNGGAVDLTNHDELVSPFYGGDLIDDLQLSFLDDHTQNRPKRDDLFYPDAAGDCRSPSAIGDGGLYNYSMGWGANGHYRRSLSVADLCLSSEAAGSGLGWKPCLYFAKGYCKNGSSCRFLHDLPDDSKMDAMVEQQCHELLLRSKSQRFGGASQLMPPSPSSTTKSMNFLLQHQNDTQRAAGFMGRPRMERIDFAGMMNPGSRQIYLTFPADSTFREEDVSNYFSIYGPVQDVRIPYQQKRMFGFVTFLYPETVKLILAKGNPHFVCDARVLVKPYKEKGRVPDKYRKQQQQLAERRDFSGCTTPTGLDSRDPYDLGSWMLYSSSCKDVLLRRKIEEQQQAAELQQAIELQGRQFMGLQLLDLKKRALTSPNADHIYTTSSSSSSSSSSSEQSSPGDKSLSPAAATTVLPFSQAADRYVGNGSPHGLVQQAPVNGAVADKEESPGEVSPHGDTGFKKSADYNLPDSPFASPTRASFVAAADTFSTATPVAEAHESIPASPYANSNNHHLVAAATAAALLPATDMAPFKSCFLQIPRFSSGHEAVGM